MTSYILSAVYRGRRINIDYWPAGNGTDYYGYVTSFSQFHDEMAEKCGVSDLEFYVYDSDGDSKEITNSRQLRKAVAHLDDRDSLLVGAYSADKRDEEYWRTNESDDEETDNEAESSDEEENEYYAKYRNIDARLSAILKRFVLPNSECYQCEKTKWSGLGYVYYSSSIYCLCDSCYGGLSRSEKRTWVRCGLPWDEDVPSYPLHARSDYAELDDVRHLQYLLTRFGYLSLSATSGQTGSYRERTQDAVRRFREEYGIYGKDMTKYDRKTASKLGEVVRQYRYQGYSYI